MTSMNNTFLTDLCPSKIAAIIGKKGSNIIQNINDVAKKEYCNAVMDSDAEDIRVITKFWKSDDKVYAGWNNIDDVEMRIFNPILEKIIKKEVERVNSLVTREHVLQVYNGTRKPDRNYIIQVDVRDGSIPKMIGKKGANIYWLNDKIKQSIVDCGQIHTKIFEELQDGDTEFYGGLTDKYDGGGKHLYIYIKVENSEKVFKTVIVHVKHYLEKLFPEPDSDDEVNEYEEYDKGDW